MRIPTPSLRLVACHDREAGDYRGALKKVAQGGGAEAYVTRAAGEQLGAWDVQQSSIITAACVLVGIA